MSQGCYELEHEITSVKVSTQSKHSIGVNSFCTFIILQMLLVPLPYLILTAVAHVGPTANCQLFHGFARRISLATRPPLLPPHTRLEKPKNEQLWKQPLSKDWLVYKYHISPDSWLEWIRGLGFTLAPEFPSGTEFQLSTGVTFVIMDLLLAAFLSLCPSCTSPPATLPNKLFALKFFLGATSGEIYSETITLNMRKEFSLWMLDSVVPIYMSPGPEIPARNLLTRKIWVLLSKWVINNFLLNQHHRSKGQLSKCRHSRKTAHLTRICFSCSIIPGVWFAIFWLSAEVLLSAHSVSGVQEHLRSLCDLR